MVIETEDLLGRNFDRRVGLVLEGKAGNQSEGRGSIFPGQAESTEHLSRLTGLRKKCADATFDVAAGMGDL